MYIITRVLLLFNKNKFINVFLIKSQKSKEKNMGFVDEVGIWLEKQKQKAYKHSEEERARQDIENQKRKMTYDELAFYIHNSGMSIKEFADLLNMQPNSITNLKKEGTPIPKLLFAVALLVYKVNQLGGNAKEVLEPFEFEKIKPKRKSDEEGLFKKK